MIARPPGIWNPGSTQEPASRQEPLHNVPAAGTSTMRLAHTPAKLAHTERVPWFGETGAV